MTDMPQRQRHYAPADDLTPTANPARTTVSNFQFTARTPTGTGTMAAPTADFFLPTGPDTRTTAGLPPTPTKVTTTSVSGWAQMHTTLDAAADFIRPMDIGAEPTIIKFLDSEPFDALREHWLDDVPGKKGWRCLGEGCPLCWRLGDKPARTKIHFAIVSFENPPSPAAAVLQTGAKLGKMIEKLAGDRRYQPDGLLSEKLYAAVYKTGSGKSGTEYHLNEVRDRDLVEDWDIEPLTAAQFQEYYRRRQVEPIERVPTAEELDKLVEDLQKPQQHAA